MTRPTVPALKEASHAGKLILPEPLRPSLGVVKPQHPEEKLEAVPRHGGGEDRMTDFGVKESFMVPHVLQEEAAEVVQAMEGLHLNKVSVAPIAKL